MAVDRGNDRVRYLYSAFNPAVLRSIRSDCETCSECSSCITPVQDLESFLFTTAYPYIGAVVGSGWPSTRSGSPAGMCGEAAADPLLIPLWISFGLTEYSVGPASILATRAAIAGWSHEEARALAEAPWRSSSTPVTSGTIMRTSPKALARRSARSWVRNTSSRAKQ